MTKLFEVLAAEQSVSSQAELLLADTLTKFKKGNQFSGLTKTLTHLTFSEENKVKEAQFKEDKPVANTVKEELGYTLDVWAKREDLLFTKNANNRLAVANIEFRGSTIATDVPVDELMGLEMRLTKLREVIRQAPTLDASKTWEPDTNRGPGYFRTKDEVTSARTERVITHDVIVPATDKFPAQVKENSRDAVVGRIVQRDFSGAATTHQLAQMLTAVDELLVAVKQARNRANNLDVTPVTIGKTLVDIIMAPLAPVVASA